MHVDLVAINTIQEKPTLLIQIDQQQQLYKVFDIQQMANKATCCPGIIEMGYWGGIRGKNWNPTPNGIKEIIIWYEDTVFSISCSDKPCPDESGDVPPVSGSPKHETIIFHPDEFLTSLSGTTVLKDGDTVIQSLKFYTNKTAYGPYGETDGGTPFDLHLMNAEIVSFFGRQSDLLNAIAVQVIRHPH
ncbi:hypothetical protein Dsin_022504 [Dipteronia sinensis]|uniref:Jacalin-type lectin domain-containing protein n=1 Tax=Dipteronia sinensis TaxID=43782 RepID=A0AAE0E047_9ROSI|nr:hypothetical protein Dsin_022504 [Dipteronia sinensis]